MRRSGFRSWTKNAVVTTIPVIEPNPMLWSRWILSAPVTNHSITTAIPNRPTADPRPNTAQRTRNHVIRGFPWE